MFCNSTKFLEAQENSENIIKSNDGAIRILYRMLKYFFEHCMQHVQKCTDIICLGNLFKKKEFLALNDCPYVATITFAYKKRLKITTAT